MKFTLLIIDDEKNIRDGLAANFELEDYNVKTASSGEEGIELISKGDIDLVITDLRMPGISGEEVLKKVNVLSGGEKVRCMLSKMMLSGANFLMLDQPTDHLDVETITSLNEALINFKGAILFSTHDHEFIETTANRIIDFKDDGKYVDKMTTYEEYLKLNK